MVDAHSVGMKIYAARQRQYLLLAMQPGAARIHLMPEKLPGRGPADAALSAAAQIRPRQRARPHRPARPHRARAPVDFEHPEHGTTRLVAGS
ncbi:MAG: hypothetical protein R3A10_07775 [Caldilineaceae bacterium]